MLIETDSYSVSSKLSPRHLVNARSGGLRQRKISLGHQPRLEQTPTTVLNMSKLFFNNIVEEEEDDQEL